MRPPVVEAPPDSLSALFRHAYAAFSQARGEMRRLDGPGPAASPAAAEDAAREMSAKVADIAAALRRSANLYLGQADSDQVRQLLLTFAAIVDEVLLNTEWAGAAVWDRYLLEVAYFRTQLAGTRLPRMAAAVLAGPRSQTSVAQAELYLDCFNLGFQGSYRNNGDDLPALEELRARLFAYAYGYRTGPRIESPDFRLNEAKDLHVRTTGPGERALAAYSRWYLVPIIALCVPLLASAVLSVKLRAPLDAYISQILKP
jgi:type IV/VI secretion system ImpK/VasF family protein